MMTAKIDVRTASTEPHGNIGMAYGNWCDVQKGINEHRSEREIVDSEESKSGKANLLYNQFPFYTFSPQCLMRLFQSIFFSALLLYPVLSASGVCVCKCVTELCIVK